jgi:hypothetical protein
MKITTMTILLVLISVGGIWTIIHNLRHDRIGLRAAAIWIILWIGVGFFSIYPTAFYLLMSIAQMSDPLFFVSLCGILVLLALVFGLTTELEKTRKQLAHLIQELALYEFNKEVKKVKRVSSDEDRKS